jgi:hypothetical protein
VRRRAHYRRAGVPCVRAVLDRCGFAFPADLSASRVHEFVAALRDRPAPLPPLDPAKAEYTKKELAVALGLTVGAVPPLIRRHQLPAEGNGKARRYPRSTAEALRAARSRGSSVRTANIYSATGTDAAGPAPCTGFVLKTARVRDSLSAVESGAEETGETPAASRP